MKNERCKRKFIVWVENLDITDLASLRDCFLLRLYALEFSAVSNVVSLLVHAITSLLN